MRGADEGIQRKQGISGGKGFLPEYVAGGTGQDAIAQESELPVITQ